MSEIIQFFNGTYTNQSDKSFYDILAMSDEELEHTHDWIQWFFPLPEPSLAVPDSPILSNEDIRVFHSYIDVKAIYWVGVSRAADFYISTDYWLKYTDHNHKRITRILRSMSIILSREDALLFYDMIHKRNEKAGFPVSPLNAEYWYKEMFPS